MSEIFITRQPVVSKQGKLIATRLSLHPPTDATDPMKAVTEALQAVEEFWPTGNQALFLSLGDTPVTAPLFDWLVPENATVEMGGAVFDSDARDALVAAARGNGANLLLRFDDRAAAALGAGLKFRFIGLDAARYTPAQIKVLVAKLAGKAGIPIALHVDSPEVFAATADAGVGGAAGWFCKQFTAGKSKTLAPNQAHIMRLLNLVRNNADIPQIETALKQDVALSYKLLRYINSAGFGLSCEITSFRHAVTMLGYAKLHKWLSLLLVTASKDPLASVLMHAALTRARFMELAGRGLVDRGELDNLFIAGAFSMLDALLGVTMAQALEAMHLPEPIVDALLHDTGPYAPVYRLALACEEGDCAQLAELATHLSLDARTINAAQLQALDFSAMMDA